MVCAYKDISYHSSGVVPRGIRSTWLSLGLVGATSRHYSWIPPIDRGRRALVSPDPLSDASRRKHYNKAREDFGLWSDSMVVGHS